ncbi:MAG: GNAT family N-acetyltransferase [Myxococcota bacterium]
MNPPDPDDPTGPLAGLPRERDETLAFWWPDGAPAPAVPHVPGTRLDSRIVPASPRDSGPDRAAFVAVQRSIGFDVTDAIWERLRFTHVVLARDADGTPIAVACGEPRANRWTELSWVAVAPAHRGRGLGAAVCAELVGWLLAHGHDRIVGSTQDTNLPALRVYLSLGFVPVGRDAKRARWNAVLKTLSGR